MPAPEQAAQRRNKTAWHARPLPEVVEALGSDVERGLGRREAAASLARHGANRLARRPPKPQWRLFLEQFKSVLILVLLVAAALAFVVGDLKDSIVIFTVVVLNAALGYYQEHRAELAVAALKHMLTGTARVRRDGQLESIDLEEVVPGDIVLAEAGDRLPADGRIAVAHAVEIDESALTGESHPVEKQADAVLPAETALADRVNSVFMSTIMTRGRLEFLVTGTGMSTQMGELAGMLDETVPAPTPLQVQLDGLGKRLTVIAVVIVSLLLAVDLLRGHPLEKEVMDAIALAVAAIPEGLPAVVTVTLALGMQRMARSRAIVKKLAAVETLGCTTVICSDKTGTLTMNQMTARAAWFRGVRFDVSGEGYGPEGKVSAADGTTGIDLEPLALPAALCNDAQIDGGVLSGDPTEGALLAFATKTGLAPGDAAGRFPRSAELPFDSRTKLMATFHEDGERIRLFVKGAPDVLAARSTQIWQGEGVGQLDEAGRMSISTENERLAALSMRVLAVSERSLPSADFDPAASLDRYLADLTFVGLVGILDPPRAEARAAIELCRHAGIRVKMITGDHPATAVSIAVALGIDPAVMTGPEIEAASDVELSEKVEATDVFARVSPEHKLRIVRALQAHGHVVAMTGDGVNDAPALKQADIGIAMGDTGTEVAKEAAAMVLADDNFATIVAAVKEGRTIYDNILKFVRFQLSTNVGAILTVFGASVLSLPTPFTPIQMLWINMIMDGPPAMTLGVDSARPGIMDDPPRRRTAVILTWRRFGHLFFHGLTMAVGTLFAFQRGMAESGESHGLTMAFTTFVLFQVFNAFNARNETLSVLRRASLGNWRLWTALVVVVALQIIVVYWPPAQSLFRTDGLGAIDWLVASAIAAGILLVEELRKVVASRLSSAAPRTD
ncbi:MAG: cation-translocating P-type ATPase [Myxococcales bacterium]|nr:cation-translocating P-type ATPase [Myxococcales bacterium]